MRLVQENLGWQIRIKRFRAHLDIRESNRVPNHDIMLDGRLQHIQQGVFIALRLLEWIFDREHRSIVASRSPEASALIPCDPSPFDLQDENALRWVTNHKVRLSIASSIPLSSPQPSD